MEHGWKVVECSPPARASSNEMSTDPRRAALAARRARVMHAARRGLEPLTRAVGVQPEAFAPNNLWALTGRRSVRAAIEREQPDVVLATAPPPSAMFASAASDTLPLVVELRDLWAGNPYFDRGGSLLPALQRRVLRRAAAIVTVTEGCRETLVGLHPELSSRIHILPNGFDPVLLKYRHAATPRRQGRATLIHAGALYGDRTAEALLAALGRAEMAQGIRLELLGAVDPRTRRAVGSLSGIDIVIQPPVSWEEATARMAAADVVVVINAPGTGGDMAIPTKLYEALALGRPVLALARSGGDTARLLERLGQGAGLAPPDDPVAISAAIERLLAGRPKPVPAAELTEFNRDRIAAGYATLLDEVATRSTSATNPGTTASRR
jgi:glycosyltransferase involved in cell wall biosynthesis